MYFNQYGKIKFEGKTSKNPFSFKFYNENEVVLGKSMKDYLKFSMAYWHTMTGSGKDPFGDPTMERPWDIQSDDKMTQAKKRLNAAFEFMQLMGIEYFCFHDVDIAPEGDTLAETNKNLDEIVEILEKKMKETGIKLLWGTCNAFGHKRYVNGVN